MSRPEPIFLVQDIWTGHADKYCEECPYRQTHVSYVPEGDTYADYVLETCAVLNDPSIPETECAAWDDWHKDEDIDEGDENAE